MTKRVFLIVLDSFGIGEAPDAAAFGDAGANTLNGVAGTGLLSLPNLCSLGLGCIDGVTAVEKSFDFTTEPSFLAFSSFC